MTDITEQMKRTTRMRLLVAAEFRNVEGQLVRECAALRCALIDNGLVMMDGNRFVYPLPQT